MSTVNLVGGLGNQLFQYLFGRTLAVRTGRQVVYETSDFETYSLHGGLAIEKVFDVSLPRATEADRLPRLIRGYQAKRVLAKVARFLPIVRTEGGDALNDRPARFYLGYWQGESYTPADLDGARKALRFRREIAWATDAAFAILAVDQGTAAAVHIRRGDYLTLPKTAPNYALPMEWYEKAMDHLEAEGVRRFVIFSDDIAGARALLRPRNLTFVTPDVSSSAGTDLALMARFERRVISNSTFGWWAAVLGPKDGQIIAPDPWLNPLFRGHAIAPQILEGWTVLPV